MDWLRPCPILVECSVVEKEVRHLPLFAYFRDGVGLRYSKQVGVAFPTAVREFYAGNPWAHTAGSGFDEEMEIADAEDVHPPPTIDEHITSVEDSIDALCSTWLVLSRYF
ncbi:hypothetical protein Acr_10g0006480 [Actinidia rufa]|uniref:Uncharacterized protein n=1 Tax=Actinidia rufa TaxID=165716 RepID=A0A7J0F9H9_9ERIC|nr:hypothetical protein Acr_10g0006480 [Actinidia rufa]